MNKQLLILLFGLFLINSVLALDCQYTEKQEIEKSEIEYYINGNLEDVSPPFIEINGIRSWKETIGYIRDYEFFVENKIRYPLEIIVYYNVEGTQKSQNLNLDPFGKQRIKGAYHQDKPGLDGKSIYFEISNIEENTRTYSEEIEVCKKCDGKTCLNDNERCKLNSECGSGICNLAGFCGHKKIVDCPNGKLNCNNETCLLPSSKKTGEGYNCIWECESGVGEEGACKRGLRDNLIFFIRILLGFGIAGYFIIKSFHKKGWARKEREIIQKAEIEAKKIISKSQKDLEKINHEILDKENKKDKLKEELNSLKSKKSNSEKIRSEIIRLNDEIENLSEKQKEKRNRLKEEREKLTKERLTPFTNKQGYKVYINEEGYEVLERTGTLFHRWWFEHNKNRKIKPGYEIHHKDFNKRNNNIKNLKEITHDQHRELHYKRYKK
jgi:hypothetical protein